MKVTTVLRIVGALLFEPTAYAGERGFFSRTFDSFVARESGIDPGSFVQDSIYGAIYVVVDLRPDSPTFRNWEGFELRITHNFLCKYRLAAQPHVGRQVRSDWSPVT